jgi:hypothetical protein
MNVIAMSSQAWTHERDAAEQLVRRIASGGGQDTVILDRPTVSREVTTFAGAAQQPPPPRIREIAFSDWLKPGLVDGGVLDVHAVRRAADGIPTDHVVVVDARSHRPDLVSSALGHLRHAWFPLDRWHPAFVVVFDDIYLIPMSDVLAGTFYCQPRLLTPVETNRMLRQTMRRAMIMRWLGPGVIRWQRRLFVAIANRYALWSDAREEHLEMSDGARARIRVRR